jgi:hypothetical protein
VTAHTARAHATLAPSAAERWLNCPGSIKLSEGIPNTTSVFAAEGTAAHELAAHCLETGDDPSTFTDMWIDIKAKDSSARFVDLDEQPEDDMRYFPITDEMTDGVALYAEYVKSLASQAKGEVLVESEQRLDMTHLHPSIFGTGDATVLDVEARHLHVIDFKYGKGVAVDADENPQLMLYAAGAARRHHNHNIERLTVHIVQPRASHSKGTIRSFDLDLIDLFEFQDKITEGANRTDEAAARYDSFRAGWEGEYLAPGEWCRFCPAYGVCPAARQDAYDAAMYEDDGVTLLDPEKMTLDQLSEALTRRERIKNWADAVAALGHAVAEGGQQIPGFKLVAKRAMRKWKDAGEAEDHLLLLGYAKADIYVEPKLQSPAKLERLFPGKNKNERQAAMTDLVEKKSSGTNLAPLDDPRPPVEVGGAADFETVEGIE